MSWDSYVSEQLIATGIVKQGAICGLDGNTWAASAGFTISQDEGAKIVAAFKDPSPLQMSGMYIGGERFIFLSGSDATLRGKKGKLGVHIAKSKTAVILGIYEEPTQPQQCAIVVEALSDYLTSVNY